MRGDLSSARIWDIEHGIHYHVWKILLGERTTRNLISESYHCLPAKCACQRNWPTNKMGSHFSAGRSENCLKVWGVIWQFDQQFLQVISSGRHKPTPVRAAGCCEMSPYYLSAAKAEGCVVRQAFGKGLEYEWEGGNALNTVERWSGQCMGFSLQRWRYIERGWAQQPGGLWCRDCLSSPQALNCALQPQYITFPSCPPECSPLPHNEPIESILVFHSGCIICPPTCCCESMLFLHLESGNTTERDATFLSGWHSCATVVWFSGHCNVTG